MADDVLLQKVHNFICGSGGFVELSVLFKRPAPLGSRKSELDSRKWLKSRSEFIAVKDHNGEEKGVRINLRKKICQQYVVKGSCRRGHDKCKHWHICKSFIEEDCDGTCGLSHDFHDQGNYRKVNELGLEKYSNGSLRKIISWSLPKICELYLRNECKSDKCPDLHVCAKEAQGLSCNCALSHSLTDCHNMNVLKEYDLVPPSQIVNVDFVRCSILVLGKHECLSSSEGSAAVTQKPATSRFKNSTAAIVFFERLCKEFSCSASLANLLDQNVVLSSELEDFLPLLEVNKDKFLVTRDECGTIQDVSAFCPNLRLCPDFVSFSECRKSPCPRFHLCRKFVTGSCNRGESCSRSHSFRNKRDTETLSKLNLDGLTDEQLRQLMLSSSPQVCMDYNNSNCNSGSLCSRVHICKRFVTNGCRKGKSCCLDHNLALDSLHTSSLLEKYTLDDTSLNEVLRALLVCEDHNSACGSRNEATIGRTHSGSLGGLNSLPTKKGDFVEQWVMDLEPKQSSSSQIRRAQRQKRRSSVSSSCSSVTAHEKFNPSKKTVFDSICKEYDGTVSYSVISKRGDLFPGNSKDIANWFRERIDKFLLREDAGGNILEVTSFSLKARLCFNYLSSQSCSREDCQYFHVCREYIAGSCKFFSRCKWRHDFQSDEDRDFISKLELDGLTQEELRKVVRFSMPQVCLDYNSGSCNRGLCDQIHICKAFVRRKCSDFDDCDLEHENALLTPRATAIFEKYGLTCSDASTKSMLKEVLVCESSSSMRKESRSSFSTSLTNLHKTRRLQSDDDFVFPVTRGVPTVSDGADSNNGLSKQRTSATKWTPCWPDEQKVFECLCTDYDCSVSFSVIAKRTDLFPHGLDSAEGWFRRTKGSFLITENDKEKGKISQVEAFSTRARLCSNYTSQKKCQKVDCPNLHVCKDYITDSCSRAEMCPLNHHFHNKRDKALLSTFRMDMLTEQQLRKLVLTSTPQLCVDYNNGVCSRGHSCRKIHICCGYLRKCCRGEYCCGLDHEAALKTDHTRAVFDRLKITKFSSYDMPNMIFDDRLSLSGKDKTNCNIHNDNPDTPICSRFLSGECQKGVRCLQHHCSLPYHWQYEVPHVREWKSFSEKDNLTLEKLYCDVSVDTQVSFKPVQVLDISLLKSTPGFPVEDYEIKIDFNNMLMNLLWLHCSHVALKTKLRRLTTIAYESQPCDIMQTKWTWYWKENGNVWLKYGKDRSGRDLQLLIEQAFLDGSKQMKFKHAAHEYILLFHSSSSFAQVNLKTGTKRTVKRRPGEYVCLEDMEDLKWRHGDSSLREQIRERSTKYKYIPSYWSSAMAPNSQYERVSLFPYEEEYKTVEQCFRRTMHDGIRIHSIDRVQNPFMWEKYCRKKENMMALAKRTRQTVNEKQLFHGTSPDAVEAICKQNFDWRLHGKNATKYGEGSYFAVNASYSHAYAKRSASSDLFMFVAKVLVGSYTTGHSSYRRPPLKNPSDPASDLYDSCVDNQANPTIFVVFDTDQFYPEYIIKYDSAASQTTSTSALPQPRRTPSQAKTPISHPQKSILKQPVTARPNGTSAYYAPQQPSAALSRPNPPSSQPLKGILKHPARSSSSIITSSPNVTVTRSSYSLSTTGSVANVPQRSSHVVTAVNSSVPVSRSGHYSTVSTNNSLSSSSPLGAIYTSSSSSAPNLYHTVSNSSHGITPTRQGGSALQSVGQASASNTSFSTPFNSKSSVSDPLPKKKKDCVIM